MTRTDASHPGASAQLLARLFLVCTMVGSGGYVFLYLWRWEWNRALISGLFFLAAEIALLASGVASRLRRLEAEVAGAATRQARADVARDGLIATRPVPRERFTWLEPTTRMGVFVPVLMGAGVLLSALAWAVERLARMTARPALEHRLAWRLAALTVVAPPGGLVPPATRPLTVPAELRPRWEN